MTLPKKPTTVKLKDLAAATNASVKAALAKAALPGVAKKLPGTLAGFWLDEAALKGTGVSAKDLAADVAKGVTTASGIKVQPTVLRGPGGVLVGYRPPAIRKG